MFTVKSDFAIRLSVYSIAQMWNLVKQLSGVQAMAGASRDCGLTLVHGRHVNVSSSSTTWHKEWMQPDCCDLVLICYSLSVAAKLRTVLIYSLLDCLFPWDTHFCMMQGGIPLDHKLQQTPFFAIANACI